MTLQTSAPSTLGLPTGMALSLAIGDPLSCAHLDSANSLLAILPSVGERIFPVKLIEMLEALLASDLDIAARVRLLQPGRLPCWGSTILLGLIAQIFVSIIQDHMNGLHAWAVETRFENPFGLIGQLGLWLVDLADEVSPGECTGPLSPDFRGWVLFPPEDFVHMLDSARVSETSVRGRGVRPFRF